MERRGFFRFHYVKGERRKSYRRWAILMVLATPAFFLSQRYLFSTGKVIDVSMQPTLREGQYFIINKLVYQLRSPRWGEIVVVRPEYEKNWLYVKRIIGLPGDKLQIKAGQVRINDEVIEESYVQGETFPDVGPLTIPSSAFFVMGDNREESEDSRQFGPVPQSRIEGKIR